MGNLHACHENAIEKQISLMALKWSSYNIILLSFDFGPHVSSTGFVRFSSMDVSLGEGQKNWLALFSILVLLGRFLGNDVD